MFFRRGGSAAFLKSNHVATKAGEIEGKALPSGGVAVQATKAGEVFGSKAGYEKQIDSSGTTVRATKTTYDPQGNVVHVKDKMTGEDQLSDVLFQAFHGRHQ